MPTYGQNNCILKTIRFENIREHWVKFENIRGYSNRQVKFENIRGFREHVRTLTAWLMHYLPKTVCSIVTEHSNWHSESTGMMFGVSLCDPSSILMAVGGFLFYTLSFTTNINFWDLGKAG